MEYSVCRRRWAKVELAADWDMDSIIIDCAKGLNTDLRIAAGKALMPPASHKRLRVL